MSTRTIITLLLGVSLMAGTQTLWGQNVTGTHGIRRYFDPQSKVLVALPVVDSADAEPPATTTVTGTLVFNFTVTVKANISSTAKIQCTATATVFDTSTTNQIIEQDTVLATRSGSTATCSPTIPYSWNLGSSSTDKVSLGWILSAPSEASTSSALPSRLSEQTTFASISVPANGSTTTETLTPTF